MAAPPCAPPTVDYVVTTGAVVGVAGADVATAGAVAACYICCGYCCCGCQEVTGAVSTEVPNRGSCADAGGKTAGAVASAGAGAGAGAGVDTAVYGCAIDPVPNNDAPDSESRHKLTTSDHVIAPPPVARLCKRTLSKSARTPTSNL